MTKERFKTVLGKFSGNYIYCDDETIIAITYGIVKEKIEDSFGFFLMKWCNSRECWIIINWVAIWKLPSIHHWRMPFKYLDNYTFLKEKDLELELLQL